MNGTEAKVRCLELAFQMKRGLTSDANAVVETATVLYDFINAPQVEETPPVTVDKPKKGRPSKVTDLLD